MAKKTPVLTPEELQIELYAVIKRFQDKYVEGEGDVSCDLLMLISFLTEEISKWTKDMQNEWAHGRNSCHDIKSFDPCKFLIDLIEHPKLYDHDYL